MRSNERRLKVRIAIARYLDGDYEGAIDATQRVIRSYPEFPLIYRWLAAALGQGSRTEEAPQALDKAIAIGAGTFDMYVRRRAPWHRPKTTSICVTAKIIAQQGVRLHRAKSFGQRQAGKRKSRLPCAPAACGS